MKRILVALVALSLLVSCGGRGGNVFHIGPVAEINTLHAPWDGLDDNTLFRCFSDSEWFYFMYEVEDATITLVEDYQGEKRR